MNNMDHIHLIFTLNIFVIVFSGCASTQAIEARISRLEEHNAMLRKDNLDLNIKIEETNNLLYVIQDKLTQLSKSVEELKSKPVTVRPKKLSPDQVQEVSSDSIYRKAYDALNSGDIDAAEEGFRQFLEKYPEHSLADNSQYWLGECFYHRGNYLAAINEFNMVLKNYPSGDKVCDAALKIGYSYFQLGNIIEGKKYLQNVISSCPGTPVAKKAEEKFRILEKN